MKVFSPITGLVLFLISAITVCANNPGGGNGTGANVTLVNNGDGTVTMGNGAVSAKIKISTAQLLQLTYLGVQVTDGGTSGNNAFYWQGGSGSSDTLTTVVDPSTNGGDWAMIRLNDYSTNNTCNADAYRYFAIFRGSPGIYVTEDMERTASAPSGGGDIPSLTCKLNANIFSWMGQDTGRFMPRQSGSDTAIAIDNGPVEVTLLTSGRLAGQFECKYDYCGDLGSLHFMGWATTNRNTNFGLWLIHPSREYFSCGPKHAEIIGQIAMFNTTFKGVHLGFNSDLNYANGESWSRIHGPMFFYFNQVPQGTLNPQFPLYADAAAQADAEANAWPYVWFASNTNYAQAPNRGTVTGKIVISDSGNPNASAANLWVGLEQRPSTPTSPAPSDFQLFGKNYQFWTHTDTNGNFAIPNVVAGANYTLFAFGPGAIGQFQSQALPGATTPISIAVASPSFSVTVSGGTTNNLGTVTWTPARVGATVFEIGVPDRDSTEFRHGSDYWHGDIGNATNFPVNWAPFMNYGLDFPNGVNYTNGLSRWSVDWDYAQPTLLDPATGNLNGTTQKIYFNLPATPGGSAQASIYLAFAADVSGPIIVSVNGANITTPATGFFPDYSDLNNDAMIRMNSHGIFCDQRINFAANLLHQGQNVITLNMRKGGYFANSALYDYLRVELSDYVPPAPTELTAIAGNGVVVLNWLPSSGATSYVVSRSMTSGSGYVDVATNVLGPVVGSDVSHAAYADNTVVNGVTYYYVVKAANSNGGSANSIEAAATPSTATASAPSPPVGLTVTPGNLQASVTWNASLGAATYTVRRTVIGYGLVANNSDGTIPTNIVDSFIVGTNYADRGLANNYTYAYTVSAANANGESVTSGPAIVIPSSNVPSAPVGLAATVISNQVNLSWSPVSGAANYSIRRATSSNGTYVVVDSYPTALSTYSDAGLNYNTTYYYEVASANLAGFSTNSAPIAVTTTPAPPAPVTAIPGNGQILVDWADAAGATNYVVRRATVNGGPYSTIASTTNSSYLDATVVNGTTYYYVVYATGPNGTGPISTQTSGTPSTTPEMIKSDTTTMSSSGDWSGVTPTIGQIGLFNNIISAVNASTLGLGGDVAIGGLIFTNNLNGNVTVGAGNTLTLGSAGIDMSRANRSVTFNSAISIAASQIWNITNTQSLTINGAFTSGGNTVIKTGSGTLFLGYSASDVGATIQVNSGLIQANASSGTTIALNGGTFKIAAADSNPINVLSGGTEQNDTGNRTWSGSLTGSGPLTVIATATHTWSGNNSGYTGTITLQGTGAMRLSSVNAVSANTAYNFNGGTMNANASGLFNLGSLSGVGTINTASGQNFSIGALGANSSFSGVIAGAGFVVKSGAGTLTLSGANTFSGGTIVSNGVLLVNNSLGSGTGANTVAVYSGGELGGKGFIAGAVTVNSGGTFAPGNGSGTVGVLTINSSVTLAAGCTNIFEISHTPLTNDTAKILGALTNGGTLVVTNIGITALANGDSFKLFDAASYSGSFANILLPSLAPGLVWNTNLLNANGIASVEQLATPTITSIQFSGANLSVGGSGGTGSSLFVIQCSTNLLTGEWMPLATNYFDAGGNFSETLTNVVNSARPQSFFRLQIH